VGYGICGGVLGANVCHTRVGGFAGFREGIVARIEVLAFLLCAHKVSGLVLRVSGGRGTDIMYFELILKKIFLVGKFAIEAEQALLIS
jgi:hypothetical protein